MLALMCMQAEDDGQGSCPRHVVALADHGRDWPSIFYLLVSFFYLYSPSIAAVGIVVGVWALMFQDTNAAYQWITFACFISVLAFLAIAAPVYLLASDPTKGVRKVFQRRVKKSR
jgi:hypothetical protein